MYRNRIIPADLKRRFRSSKKVCQAVEGRPSNRTFFVVVVGCIGGGNYGILIVMFVEFRVARSRHNAVVGRLVPAPF